MLIGITGQIGAGKTAVALILKKHGAHVISADRIGKEVVESNTGVLSALVKKFSRDILTPSGRLRRKKLGEMAFSSLSNRQKLDKIVHPPLLKELHRQSREALKKFNLVVIDAALLINWGWHKKVDYTILVNAGKKIKIARLMSKGFSPKEAQLRLNSQSKYLIFKNNADFIILNNQSLDSLEVKVKKILKKIRQKGLTLAP